MRLASRSLAIPDIVPPRISVKIKDSVFSVLKLEVVQLLS